MDGGALSVTAERSEVSSLVSCQLAISLHVLTADTTANYVELIEDGEESAAAPEPEAEEEEEVAEPVTSSDSPSATALYDYAADEEGELSQYFVANLENQY